MTQLFNLLDTKGNVVKTGTLSNLTPIPRGYKLQHTIGEIAWTKNK